MSESSVAARVGTRMAQGVGYITLERPDAINAVDIDMIRAIGDALEKWRAEPDVSLVVLEGAGDRGFCAGGDVRALHAFIAAGDADGAEPVFLAEYRLDAAIAEYPKTIVSLADGVTMGGGIGLACNAQVRVVTERSRLAMPETRLGFSPDAGGSWLLGRAPGRLGEYLALTSEVIGGADAIHCGLADHLVPSERLDSLRDALEMRADPSSPAEIVMLFDETPETGPLERAQSWIDDAFAADTVVEIIERLQTLRDRGVAEDAELTPAGALAALAERSPTALVVSLAAIRSARVLRSQRRALEQEHDLMSWFLRTRADVPEGIRAQLVDKDRAPRWSPATVAEVEEDVVGYAFTHRAPQPLFPAQDS